MSGDASKVYVHVEGLGLFGIDDPNDMKCLPN